MSFVKNECPSCGATLEIDQTNRQAFCPFCGGKLISESEISDAGKVERLCKQAKVKLEAKDYDELKKIVKEIQDLDENNFYGWYYEAICIRNAPIDGTLGKIVKGLEVFSNAMVKSTVSDKKAERLELQGKGIQTLGILTKEDFLARILRSAKCVVGEEGEEREKQLNLLFGLLGEMTDVMWLGIMQKTYLKEKGKLVSEYEKKFSQFFLYLDDEIRKTGIALSKQYQSFMGKNVLQYKLCTSRFRYLWKNPTSTGRNLMGELYDKYEGFGPEDIRKKIKKDKIVRIVVAGCIVAVILIIGFTGV